MIRFKDISIPKPCSVDYDALPGDDVKRYCNSCKKQVYDFRGKDETYLNDVFQNTGKVCGIYYEDQIQKPSLKIQRPFYYALVAKFIGVGLFLKTNLSTQHAAASTDYNTPSNQHQQIDSSAAIKVHFKNRPKVRNSYSISIFINDALYKNKVSVYDGYLYMPDTTSASDSIKVIVYERKASRYLRISYAIKPQEYLFKFQDADKIIVKINYKFHFTLIKRRMLRGKVYLPRYKNI